MLSLLLQRAFHRQIRRIAVREFLAHQRKAVLFPERFTLRIAPVDRKAHLAEPLSPQFVHQLAPRVDSDDGRVDLGHRADTAGSVEVG